MRIDGHTHVFTLQQILSQEAIHVIIGRLERQRLFGLELPGAVVSAVEKWLDELVERPDYLDRRNVLRLLLKKLTTVSSFDTWASDHFSGDGNFDLQIRGLDDLGVEQLQGLLKRIADGYGGSSAAGKKGEVITDLIATMLVSMRPTVTEVAENIISQVPDEQILVALMLDIYGPSEPERDRRNFRRQIAGHTEAALQYPGRILPFFGLHPDRPDHYELLVKETNAGHVVGVKLYPSLGYNVDSDEMRRVYDFCVEKDLPVLLHCGHGGFFRDEEAIDLCDPENWRSILTSERYHGKLKVCFAHFGGWESLGKEWYKKPTEGAPVSDDDQERTDWGEKIYDYMTRPGNSVYTDLAKHNSMLSEAQDGDETYEKRYFQTLATLVSQAGLGDRFLYGTDAWLLRLEMTVADYEARWEGLATPATWEAITSHGPKSFLGFPTDETDPTVALPSNLQRFVEFMRENRGQLGANPAPWLLDRLQGEPGRRDLSVWNGARAPVRDTYQWLRQYMTEAEIAQGYRAHWNKELRTLRYFDASDPGMPRRAQKMARNFLTFVLQDTQLIPGISDGLAMDRFTRIFLDGRYQFYQVALAIDAMVDYPPEEALC